MNHILCLVKNTEVILLSKSISSSSKRVLAEAFMNSIIGYSAFTFISLPYLYHNKLHKLMILTARWINGTYDFKKSCKYIFESANIWDSNQLIVISTFNFIHILNTFKLAYPLGH